MKFLVPIIIGVWILQPIFINAEMSIVTNEMNCPITDPEYFKNVEVHVLDDGRNNECSVNLTIAKSVSEVSVIHLLMLEASDGDYVVPTGINFIRKLCAARKDTIFSQRIYKAIGAPDDCPIPPGTYSGSRIKLVETNNLPETFPPGKYMMQVSAKHDDHIYFQCNTYFTIQ